MRKLVLFVILLFALNAINPAAPVAAGTTYGTCTGGTQTITFDFSDGQQGWTLNQTPSYHFGVNIYGTWSGSAFVSGKNPSDNGYNVEILYTFPTNVLIRSFIPVGTVGALGEWEYHIRNSAGTDVYSAIHQLTSANPNPDVVGNRIYITRSHSNGSSGSIFSVSVDVSCAIPDFTYEPTGSLLEVGFTDTSVCGVSVTAWSWDFQNNGSADSTNQNPVYTFAAPGVYTTALTITCDGTQYTTTKTVTV